MLKSPLNVKLKWCLRKKQFISILTVAVNELYVHMVLLYLTRKGNYWWLKVIWTTAALTIRPRSRVCIKPWTITLLTLRTYTRAPRYMSSETPNSSSTWWVGLTSRRTCTSTKQFSRSATWSKLAGGRFISGTYWGTTMPWRTRYARRP